jgi:hypothetical protein
MTKALPKQGERGAAGECSLCAAPIDFADFGKLSLATGWTWQEAPEGHIRPICARCKAVSQKQQEEG